MRRQIIAAAAGMTMTALALGIYVLQGNPVPESFVANVPGNPDRGAYIARMSGCIACHTNEPAGGELLAGGPPLKTPFGTFQAPNITPDPEAGIGNWDLQDFARALRYGLSPDGSPYYPAFPYLFYSKLTNQDIADLWAAFQTVPASDRKSTRQRIEFPFDQRWALLGWQRLFFTPGVFEPESERTETWNRGKYIVTGPAHCGACHTPRNMLGARDAERALHGATGLPGDERSPSITADSLKDEGWTETNLFFGLRFGTKPDGDVFGGSMGEVVQSGTSWLTDDDLKAIAHYLLNDKATD